jgi:hypothetical protein
VGRHLSNRVRDVSGRSREDVVRHAVRVADGVADVAQKDRLAGLGLTQNKVLQLRGDCRAVAVVSGVSAIV